jgi:hypothetical protein
MHDILSVRRFSDDLKVRFRFEQTPQTVPKRRLSFQQEPQAVPEYFVVIRNQDADGRD